MKIADMSPSVTPHKKGRTGKASSWSFVDDVDTMGRVRRVYHYETLMCEYDGSYDDNWFLGVVSIGEGSVSDQNGMNELLAQNGSVVRFKRDKANPRYVNTITGATVSTR